MIPTSDHNEELVGDVLYQFSLNYEWRKIIAPILFSGLQSIAATIEDESDLEDFEVRIGALIDDFYNEDDVDIPAVNKTGIWRSTNQTGIVTGSWLTILPTAYDTDDPNISVDVGTGAITVAEEGYYLINANVTIQNIGAVNAQYQMRVFDVTNASVRVSGMPESLNAGVSATAVNMINDVLLLHAETDYAFQIRCNASTGTIVSRAAVGGETSYSFKATLFR